MADTSNPLESRIVNGRRCVRLAGQPTGALNLKNCPVCDARVVYWSYYGPLENWRLIAIAAVTCEGCHMLDLLRDGGTCGWVSGWKPFWPTGGAVAAEARRIWQHPDRVKFAMDNDKDSVDWLVFADWVEECCNAPRQAAAIRRKHNAG